MGTKFNDAYDLKALLKNLWLFGLMVIIMKMTAGVGFVVFAIMTIFAVTQTKINRLVVLMMVASCALIGNNNLMPKSAIFAVEQKFMIMMLAIVLTAKLAGRSHARIVKPLMWITPFIIFMCVSSAQGWCPIISYLKIVLFSACYFAYYSMANMVLTENRSEIRSIRSAYLSLSCFMVFGSLLLIPFPAISQMNAETYMESLKAGKQLNSLFGGMTFHSQAFGPTIAVITTLLVSDLLFGIRKPDKLVMALLACCPILIYKTSSRTAFGTVLSGCLFSVYLFLQSRGINNRWKGKVTSTCLIIAIIISAVLLGSSHGRQSVMNFLLKRHGAVETRSSDLTMENIAHSRQGLMDTAMDNFHKSPMIGNGFQVSESHIGLGSGGLREILSAPIEKGVWVTAVLEEGGVIGFVLFVGFGICALFALVRRKAYCCASVFLTIYILNLGEFTFFSMSGIGGFYWFLCFVGAILDGSRMKQAYLNATPQTQDYQISNYRW